MAEYNNGMWVCQCQYRKECNRDCGMYRKLSGKLSNADRIRRMTDTELEGWLTAFVCSNVAPHATARGAAKKGRLLEWLRQEGE